MDVRLWLVDETLASKWKFIGIAIYLRGTIEFVEMRANLEQRSNEGIEQRVDLDLRLDREQRIWFTSTKFLSTR